MSKSSIFCTRWIFHVVCYKDQRHSHGSSRLLTLLVALAVHLSIIICSNALECIPCTIIVSSIVGHQQRNRHRCPNQSTTAHFLSANELTTFNNNNNTTTIRIRQRRQQQYHYKSTVSGETLCTYINYMKHQPVYQHHHDDDDDDTTTTTATTSTSGQCSILVIDDGSTDGTCQYIHEKKWLGAVPEDDDENLKKECHDTTNNNNNYWKVNDQISCISLPTNQGKGAAIARGMMELHTCCSPPEKKEIDDDDDDDTTLSNVVRSIVLVADADGSGDISCLNDMIYSLECLLESSSSATSTLSSSLSSATTMSDNNDLAILFVSRIAMVDKAKRVSLHRCRC